MMLKVDNLHIAITKPFVISSFFVDWCYDQALKTFSTGSNIAHFMRARGAVTVMLLLFTCLIGIINLSIFWISRDIKIHAVVNLVAVFALEIYTDFVKTRFFKHDQAVIKAKLCALSASFRVLLPLILFVVVVPSMLLFVVWVFKFIK